MFLRQYIHVELMKKLILLSYTLESNLYMFMNTE